MYGTLETNLWSETIKIGQNITYKNIRIFKRVRNMVLCQFNEPLSN